MQKKSLNRMMKTSFIFILWFACANSSASESKPKYSSSTLRLSQQNEYFRSHAAPDFWAMMPYYVSQQDGAACGIASLSILLNAVRVHQQLSASDTLITQKNLLEKVKIDYRRNGLTLNQLGDATTRALAVYGIKGKVQVLHADGTLEQKEKIRKLLIQNEGSVRNFLLANFFQGELTGDPEGVGHISPVAAFDDSKDRVLVLDVDREYYEPYWVSFDTFIRGINTVDKSVKQNRGIVFVALE